MIYIYSHICTDAFIDIVFILTLSSTEQNVFTRIHSGAAFRGVPLMGRTERGDVRGATPSLFGKWSVN